MPVLLNPSTLPWVSAVSQVADSAGTSADAEMQVRAHNALRAAFQHFNNKTKWDFLRTEATPIRVIAPYQFAVTASGSQTSALCAAGHGVLVDDLITGSGFVLGTRVTATASAAIGFTAALTGYGAGTQSFNASAIRDSYDIPSDWKQGYTVRLLSSQKSLHYMPRRIYDYTESNEFTPGTPTHYDLFVAYGKAKIRLVKPPSSADVLMQRYYRRMTLATSSGSTTAIDIPEDYESYPIAWAKWFFLTDKSEARQNQATTWLSLAQEGLKTMLSEQQMIPDEGLIMVPGHMTEGLGGDNTTRYLDWTE